MIFGIGTDIVRIARMAKALERFGERFAQRILTADELVEYRASAKPAYFLAKRFAAKEAAAKAMGLGFQKGLSLRHIAVMHDELGKPLLRFEGFAADFIAAHGIDEIHLSLADEEDHAVAFVTLGCRRA